MSPRELAYRYRKPMLVGVALLAMALSIAAPGQPIAWRLAAPFMALVAMIGGFTVGWMPLRFQVWLWSRAAPRVLRKTCLAVFYFFLLGTLVGAAVYPFYADDLGVESLSVGALGFLLPAGVGAAFGALRAYCEI